MKHNCFLARISEKKAETTDAINRSVPKTAWKQGDFSDLLALPDGATKYQIYDPRSATLQNGRVVRMPFAGNKGIPALNPMYNVYSPIYPAPNDVPGLVGADGLNNYYASAMPEDEKFNSIINRVDYNLAQRHRLSGRWFWNHRLADEYDWTYTTVRGLNSDGLVRINKGVNMDYVWTVSGSTVISAGASWSRFSEGNTVPVQTSYKPTQANLPAYLDTKAGAFTQLPRVEIATVATGGLEPLPNGTSTYPVVGGLGWSAKIPIASPVPPRFAASSAATAARPFVDAFGERRDLRQLLFCEGQPTSTISWSSWVSEPHIVRRVQQRAGRRHHQPIRRHGRRHPFEQAR